MFDRHYDGKEDEDGEESADRHYTDFNEKLVVTESIKMGSIMCMFSITSARVISGRVLEGESHRSLLFSTVVAGLSSFPRPDEWREMVTPSILFLDASSTSFTYEIVTRSEQDHFTEYDDLVLFESRPMMINQ
jgi:hypothetical protein